MELCVVREDVTMKKNNRRGKICRSVVYNIAVTACAACIHVRLSQRVVTYSAAVGRLKQIALSKKFKLQQSGFLRKINPLWGDGIGIYVTPLCTGIVIIPLYKWRYCAFDIYDTLPTRGACSFDFFFLSSTAEIPPSDSFSVRVYTHRQYSAVRARDMNTPRPSMTAGIVIIVIPRSVRKPAVSGRSRTSGT